MKIEQLIREKVSFLSAGQKKVAEYILQHLDSFSYSTLAKLSKEISVSETTIIRLAYSLGFESFSEMQRTVQNDILSVPTVIKDDSLLDSGNFYQNIIANELHGKLGISSESGRYGSDCYPSEQCQKTPHCWCTLFLQCRSLDGNSVESASWKYQGGSRILRFQFRISHRSIRGYSCSSDLFCPLYQMVSEICTDCQKSWSPSQTAFHHRHGRWQTTLSL